MNSTSKPNTDEENIVFPSEKLGIEEEFLPGSGTFVENHEVKVSVFGKKNIEREKYRATVYSLPRGSVVPKYRQVVIGEVIKVSKSSVKMNIRYINNRVIEPAYSAIMHISDASRDFIKDIDKSFSAGDIIRASIVDAKTIPLQLSTKKNDEGVIYTRCDICGEEVTKIKRDLLQCSNCEHTQSRKTAIDFGKLKILIED
ncbi:MAG: exosome complex RNA-binding protein Csl4 [Candidatus Heimdallarchaeota archaeon]|nr:exosome complex RNA-binding protein Csl4 [Candidatus Heimdallarchaeota archaeon]